MAGFNTLANVTIYRMGFQDGNNFYEKNYVAMVNTSWLLGAMVGALGSGPLLSYGRWNCIIGANLIVILGSAVCMIDNSIVILIGRLILGFSTGAFSVFCNKFVSEMAPAEVRGPIGSVN